MLRPGTDPIAAVRELALLLDEADEPDDDLILMTGVGPLESIIFHHELEVWPVVEELARANKRFRRALREVSATNSADYQRRRDLLFELGEEVFVNLSFVAYAEDSADTSWRYRDVRAGGRIERPALVSLLRRLADRLESGDTEPRPLDPWPQTVTPADDRAPGEATERESELDVATPGSGSQRRDFAAYTRDSLREIWPTSADAFVGVTVRETLRGWDSELKFRDGRQVQVAVPDGLSLAEVQAHIESRMHDMGLSVAWSPDGGAWHGELSLARD